MPVVEILHHVATVALNASAALAVGAALSGTWLARGGSSWSSLRLPALRRWSGAGIVLAILANCALLWLEAALMAEVPLAQAGSSALLVLTDTHYGIAWCAGMAALAVALVLWAARSPRWIALVPLAVFFYTRSMVSHAAADGDLSLAMLADWLHLVFTSLWTGAVFAAGFAVMPGSAADRDAGPHDRNAYIGSLSTCATLALAGIVATGGFNAWHMVGTLARVAGNPYSNLLLAKIGLVLLAAVLGGVNRFFTMPSVLAGCNAAATRFTRTLQAEAAVLFAVLAVAALLASTSPPIAG